MIADNEELTISDEVSVKNLGFDSIKLFLDGDDKVNDEEL